MLFHNLKITFCLFLLLQATFGIGQEDFDLETLELDFLKELNEIRNNNQLAPFNKNELLDAVAFDQSEFILKSGTLTHTQENKKKTSLIDRILFYEGLFAQAGENIAQVRLNSKVLLELGESKKTADTPEKMLLGAINSWLMEEEGKLNLLDPNFLACGISILQTDKQELVITLVMAAEPFEIPSDARVNFNNYGIEPYSKEACDAFLNEHPSLPQLFSDGFKVKDGRLSFQFNSLGFWDEIISSGKDGLAFELISRDQFDCSTTNRLFPGSIANGLLQKPFFKSKLASLNLVELEGKVNIDLGKLPSYYEYEKYEINGLILKDGKKCVSIPFNKVETNNIRWLDIPFQKSISKIDSSHTGLDTFIFRGSFKQLEFLLQNMDFLMSGLNFELDFISAEVSVAPSIQIKRDEFLAKINAVASKYSAESNLIDYEEKINWEAYNNFKKGTYYQLETSELSKEEEVEYLKKTSLSDKELAYSLDTISRIQLKFAGKFELRNSLSYEDRHRLLSILLQNKKYDLGLIVQEHIFNEAVINSKDIQKLITGNRKQVKRTLSLLNNQYIAQEKMGEVLFDGNPLHRAFLELYLIDPTNAAVAYNYHVAQLNHWAKSVGNISEIEKWKKEFEKLKVKTEINRSAYSEAYLNYLNIAADYYYEKGQFEKRKKSFDEMLKYVIPSNLSDEKLLLVAKYLTHQDQFPRAIKMLLPEVKNENVGNEVLLYFLQIAMYDRNRVPEKQYVEFLNKARMQDQTSFCKLFSKEKMGVQLLENQEIKELYCPACNK